MMHSFFIVTPPGLEGVCAKEAEGLVEVETVRGGLLARGSLADLFGMNLLLRTASRILLRLGEGPASDPRGALGAVAFSRFLAKGTTFSVHVSGGGKTPSLFVSAIRREVTRQVPSTRHVERGGGQELRVRIEKGRLNLSLDSTGAHLHRRGYRLETGAAPLRENLAAGILSLAGWDGSRPLWDPMCGSGTFLIEGALLALRRAPGMGRAFACESWPCFPGEEAQAIREESKEKERSTLSSPILGSDLRAGALGVTRRNAERAGVRPFIELTRMRAEDIAPPAGPPGLIVANPPYGRRVGEKEELASLYRGFGDALRSRFSGWKVAVLLMDPKLGAHLALPSPETIPLRNGGLPCRLLLASIP